MTKLFAVAAYEPTGERAGWLTSRGTLSYLGRRARALSLRLSAETLVQQMDQQWSYYLWVAEPLPPDVDARVWDGLDVEMAGTGQLDMAAPDKGQSWFAVDDKRQGGDMTMKKAGAAVKVKGTKGRSGRVTKAKAAGNGAGRPTKSVKGVVRKFKGDCLCNCGQPSTQFFLRGHIKRFNSNLAKVKRGEVKPEKAFGAKVAAAMGPWKKTKTGQVPATTKYDKIRAAAGA